jgi:hypothetical protein
MADDEDDDPLRNIDIEPLGPDLAEALRIICTNAGFAAVCRFAVCLRRRRCSTRQVLCWQVTRDVLNPLIRQALAYSWQARVAAGLPVNIPPVKEHDHQRLLARDREKDPVQAAKWAAEAARNVEQELAAQRKAAAKATAVAAAEDAAPPVSERTSPPPRSRRRRETGPPAARG